LVEEVHHAFVDHPDYGPDDFVTKLKRQMKPASEPAQQLMAEMLWALLLFPSNMKARTKRQQVRDLWGLSGDQLPADHPMLKDEVLKGIGSGGPGFNNYRPVELKFLLDLILDLKRRTGSERRSLLTDYDSFISWINAVPREGSRQFRHMLRFFAFPDRVERISSNNDRRSILIAFEVAPTRQIQQWTDRQLDDALVELRTKLQSENPAEMLDFYMPKLKERWAKDRKVKTLEGEVTVTVPSDQEDDADEALVPDKAAGVRQSIQIQAKLAEIGAAMGFRVWLPRNDRARVRELVMDKWRKAFIEELPLAYDKVTLDTIEQIDVLWLRGLFAVSTAETD
jgi:5-methylcytosine-specific restriction protein B